MPFICLVCCFLIIFQLISWLGNPTKCVKERSYLFENPKLLGTEGELRLQIVTTFQPPGKRKGDGVPSKASDAFPECPFEFLGPSVLSWSRHKGMKAKSRPKEMALLTKYLRHKQEDLSLVPSTRLDAGHNTVHL